MRHHPARGRRVVSLLALGFLAGSGVASGQDAAVRAAVEANNKKFTAAVAKGDAAALGGLYTADASAFPPNAEVVKGRENIQGMWTSVLASGIANAELTTTDVESQGNLATESGTYVMKAKDGTVADRGKYLVVWKKTKGQWLIHRDIWNSSMPAKP
jgi:uncharacterized protein (TIGR02246 family)